METALVTGMFETSFLSEKKVGLDVKNENTGSFSKILESSLKNSDVEKIETEDCKINQDVSSEEIESVDKEDLDTEQKIETEEITEDVDNIIEELLSDIEKTEDEPKKKDKKIRKEGCMIDFVQQNELAKLIRKEEVKEQEVENQFNGIEEVKIENKDVIKLMGSVKEGAIKESELTPEEKLNDLLSKLDVEFKENVKIKDESENVIEVGPQSVETEKIKLNINDVDRNKDVKNSDGMKKEEEQIKTGFNNLKDVEKVNEEEKEDVNELWGKEFENESLEPTEKQNKTEVDKNKVSQENGSKAFADQNELNNGMADKKGFEKEEGFLKQKEDKFKIKDFRSKEDVDTMQKFVKEEVVKLDNSLEIKDVNIIKKFEDVDVNQMDILEQVTEKLEVSLFDNKSEMVIKLKPHDLGNVTVKITIENGVMNAKFLADSTKVKEALESNLNNLKESLKDQGLNVQDLNVSVDSGRSQNHNFNQNNLIYLNDKKSYQSNKNVSYEDSYYEMASDVRKENHYWMDSTVSFLA